MHLRVFIAGLSLVLPHLARGGESGLITTYQPLVVPLRPIIWIVPVTCHQWHGHSAGSSVDFIAAKNVPPTDSPGQAKEDLNLASRCHLEFSTSDLGRKDVPLVITMDVSKFEIPKLYRELREETVIRACLECLRRCTGGKLLRTPVTLKAAEKNKKWVGEIVREYNAHDRSKVFFAFRR